MDGRAAAAFRDAALAWLVAVPVLAGIAWSLPASPPATAARVARVAAAAAAHARSARAVRPRYANPAADAPALSAPPAQCAEGGDATLGLDDQPGCTASVVASIDAARAAEGVGRLALPSNWGALTTPEQLFVLADLERVDRGLPPYVGLAPRLDAVAHRGAVAGTDPLASPALVASDASTWAGNEVSVISADYDWMYDDGYGSSNIDCTAPHAAGCWAHREVILGRYTGLTCTDCVMGAGVAFSGASSAQWRTSLTELVAAPAHPGALPVSFTWAKDVLPYLPTGTA